MEPLRWERSLGKPMLNLSQVSAKMPEPMSDKEEF
jgi:hypothetical protein